MVSSAWASPTKTVHAFLISLCVLVCPALRITTLITCSEQHELWSLLLWNFFQLPVSLSICLSLSLSLFCPNTPLSTLFSNTPSLCSFRDQYILYLFVVCLTSASETRLYVCSVERVNLMTLLVSSSCSVGWQKDRIMMNLKGFGRNQ
jgi:hypothetical protein